MLHQHKMQCSEIKFSLHAFEKMYERGIHLTEIEQVLQIGEVIAEYITDKPFPSNLLLGFVEDKPIHVVIAREPDSGICIVITAYVPNTERWNVDFKNRKK